MASPEPAPNPGQGKDERSGILVSPLLKTILLREFFWGNESKPMFR